MKLKEKRPFGIIMLRAIPGVCRRRAFLCLAQMFFIVAAAMAEGLKPQPTDQDLARQQHAFDNNLKTWKAEAIRVPVAPPRTYAQDYATMAYGHPWDFEKDTEGIRKFGAGLKDVKAGNSILSFTTSGKDNLFYWGQHTAKDPIVDEEKISVGWPEKSRWAVQMRLRQSLPESQWEVSARAFHYGGLEARAVTVTGTNWQVVTVDMGGTGQRRTSLGLECKTPANHVEIDWVKAVIPEVKIYFRKSFVLEENPVMGKFNLIPSPAGWTLYVNGQKAGDHRTYFKYIDPIDITPHLRKGTNVFALETQALRPHGVVDAVAGEGIIRLESGKMVPLITDATWKGTIQHQDRWTDLTFDDRAWKPVAGCGNLNQASPQKPNQGWMPNFLDPPYFGPIEVEAPGRRIPAFRDSEEVQLQIAVPDHPDYAGPIAWKLTDSIHAKTLAQGTLPEGKKSKNDVVTGFTGQYVRGAYELELKLKNGDTRIYEFLVFGKIPMPTVKDNDRFESGLDLKPMATIQCAETNSPYPLMDGPLGSSRVSKSAVGKYRETDDKIFSWFSYYFQIKNPYKPHLVVITYPDDGERTWSASLEEKSYWSMANDFNGGYRGWTRVASGGYTGYPYPVSGKWRTFKMVYFPQLQAQTVTISNPQAGGRAAIGKIEVFEISSELPAANMVNDAGERLWGVHSERIDLTLNNFNGSDRGGAFINHLYRHAYRGWWRDWFLAIENQMRFMRFTGQNLYFAGVYMYGRSIYPSRFYEPLYGESVPSQDYVELMARMFNANDLKLMLCVEFFDSHRLRELDRFSQREVAEGAPTIMTVSRHGDQSFQTWMGRTKSSFHPEVQKDLLMQVKELTALYKGVPGIKGIGLITAGPWLPTASPVGSSGLIPRDIARDSYDDETIRQFEDTTGVHIPVTVKGQERFARRYEWLKANAWHKWLSWRAGAIAALNLKIRDAIYYGSDKTLQYYLFDGAANACGEEMLLHGTRPADFELERGVQPQAYVNQPGLVYVNILQEMGARVYRIVAPFYADYWTLDKALSVRAARTCPEAAKLYNTGPTAGAYNLISFVEPTLTVDTNVSWYWKSMLQVGWPMPPEEHILADYANLMAMGTPATMVHTWCDCALVSGGEEYTRGFFHAFRTLPIDTYKQIAGDAIDGSVPFYWSQKGYGYMVNPAAWPVKVTLKLNFSSGFIDNLIGRKSQSGVIKDLVADKDIAIANGEWIVQLKPYQLMTFHGKNAIHLIALSTETSPEARKVVETPLKELENLATAFGIRKIKESADELNRFKSGIAEARRLLSQGRVYQALTVVKSPSMQRIEFSLQERLAQAPMLLYGPFDNANSSGFTNVYQIESDVLAGKQPLDSYTESGRIIKALPVRSSTYKGSNGYVDILPRYTSPDWKMCYLYTAVYAPEPRQVKLLLGSDDGVKVWVNGKLAHEICVARSAVARADTARITLKQGWNTLLFKVENRVGGWSLFFELVSETDAPMNDLQFAVKY